MSSLRNRVETAWRERAIGLKAISFGLVGVVNSAIDFGLFSFAYYYLGLPIIAANALAWVVAVSGSYVMEIGLAFDDAIRKIFGPSPEDEGDDIVPHKLAKAFPGLNRER